MNDTYQMLRTLTSPIVAITSRRGSELNGMVANSAMRASLSEVKPRVSVYIHKFNYSHDSIFETGEFVLHVLDAAQMDIVYALGFASRRDGDKMSNVPHRLGHLGLPILEGCYCYFECKVANVMDTGASTLFLGAVEHAGRGGGTDVMTAEFFRESLPEERRRQYLAGLAEAQAYATRMADSITPVVWRGLQG
jgi:flavin reductase (DIM6/NTAB) family NADH-FMN oxidoreductase RutF